MNAITPSTTATSRKPQKIESAGSIPPNGSATSWTMPQPSASRPTMIAISSSTPPTRPDDRRARRRRDVAHQLQDEQLAVRRRRLAELLGGDLQVAGAALGERERGLGHAPQLQALLRAGGGDRGAEVLARALGVHPLGGAGAEDRLRGGAEAGLGLELLVGPALEPLHRGQRALLLDLDLPLLGGHGVLGVYDRRRKPVGSGSGSSGLSGARARDRARHSRTARCRSARRRGTARPGTGSGRGPTPSSNWPPP